MDDENRLGEPPSLEYVCLKGGIVHDPVHDIDGAKRDVWIKNGQIVLPPRRTPTNVVMHDITGDIVMPGGVEMHCHIVGSKVNAARRYFPAQVSSDRTGILSSANATGRLFAGMGYTSAFDAAIAPLMARHAHLEMIDTPIVDRGCYLLFDNNHAVMDALAAGDHNAIDAYLAWALQAARGYAIKIVNPGGVENWKQIHRQTLHQIDEPVPGFSVTPRQIVRGLADSALRLRLPHAPHIHCNNLGVPGNWRTTLETMRSLDERPGHFAHIQFHSYGGDEADPQSFCSGSAELIDYVNTHPNISIDVGHIHPGKTLSITGDAPFSRQLWRLTGGRWFAADCEQESSCGIMAIEYQPQKKLVHAIQWAIALEWYLKMEDPWRLAMTSDHPNGGAFTRYPEMIQLLMSESARREALETMPSLVRERSCVAELRREYTLQEIAIITRAAPARLLGLPTKGHLGPGADADIVVYRDMENRTEMFSWPRMVFKSGELVSRDGQVVRERAGHTTFVTPSFDQDRIPRIKAEFEKAYSIAFENYAIGNEEWAASQTIPVIPGSPH